MSVRLGGYNVHHSTTKDETIEDFGKIITLVDICTTAEERWKDKHFIPFLTQNGWDHYDGPHPTDTGIVWNKEKYKALQQESLKIEGTWWSGRKMLNACPYILFEKRNGKRFWVIAAHTQVRGYRKGKRYTINRRVMKRQYKQINDLICKLDQTGLPVILSGDLNNPDALSDNIAPVGAVDYVKSGLDYIVWTDTNATLVRWGELEGTGYSGHRDGEVNSDHPFVYVELILKAQRRYHYVLDK